MEVNPAFVILSIDDSRSVKKADLRNVCKDWDELGVWAVIGNDKEDLADAFLEHPGFGYREWAPKAGEAGVWMSQMNAWKMIANQDRPVVVFEDDALLCPDFITEFNRYTDELPNDWDLFSIFYPANQYGDFHWSYDYDENGHPTGPQLWFSDGAPELLIESELISKAYQGYGCVALMFSPKGARALYDQAIAKGMYTPVDCFIFEQYRAGHINAYSPMPGQTRLADVDWDAPSTIRYTDRVDMV